MAISKEVPELITVRMAGDKLATPLCGRPDSGADVPNDFTPKLLGSWRRGPKDHHAIVRS